MRFLYFVSILVALAVTTNLFVKLALTMYDGWLVVKQEHLHLQRVELIVNTCRFGGKVVGDNIACMTEEQSQKQMSIQLAPVQTQ